MMLYDWIFFFSLYLTNNSTCCRNWQNSNLHDPSQTGLCINIRISFTYIKKPIFSNALFSLLDNTFNPNSHCKKMYTSFFMFIIFFFRYFRCWICVHYSFCPWAIATYWLNQEHEIHGIAQSIPVSNVHRIYISISQVLWRFLWCFMWVWRKQVIQKNTYLKYISAIFSTIIA